MTMLTRVSGNAEPRQNDYRAVTKTLSMTPPPPLQTQNYDREAVRAKYLAERDKRLVAGRADIRDLRYDEFFARYRDDPFMPVAPRLAKVDELDVVIAGGGIAGVTAGAQLHKAGIERIRIIDQPVASAAPGTGTATPA